MQLRLQEFLAKKLITVYPLQLKKITQIKHNKLTPNKSAQVHQNVDNAKQKYK